jgi:recombination protein RecR
MGFSPLVDELIQNLQFLPGVGPKSAQRLAFNMLQRNRAAAQKLATSIALAVEQVGKCTRCQILSELKICDICNNPQRHKQLLCVVETAADVLAIEQTASYRGLYYVLGGHLSPIDGIGPKELGLEQFTQYVQAQAFTEVILATGTTVEGETTAYYLANLLNKSQISSSRIAHGAPLGGELEYLDAGTLTKAISLRAKLEVSS